MSANDKISAEQQFTEIVDAAKKLTKKDTVGKVVSIKGKFYGNNNITIGLRPKIINTISTFIYYPFVVFIFQSECIKEF